MDKPFVIMKTLGDETRYRIVQLLLEHDYCVNAIAKRLDVSQSAVSQHLKVLRASGLVRGERRGYYTHYAIDRDLLRDTAEELKDLIRIKRNEGSAHCSKP
ncbi:MAG: ArsR/SmtB family transcription factor [Bacillota bacterium]